MSITQDRLHSLLQAAEAFQALAQSLAQTLTSQAFSPSTTIADLALLFQGQLSLLSPQALLLSQERLHYNYTAGRNARVKKAKAAQRASGASPLARQNQGQGQGQGLRPSSISQARQAEIEALALGALPEAASPEPEPSALEPSPSVEPSALDSDSDSDFFL